MKVAALSFGGPTAQIAVMHRVLVDEKRWISESRFLHALNYCMLLPGPEAQQLATYIGWLLHGKRGGLAAGLLFVLPGFLSILALSMLYARYQSAGPVQAVFFGLKAAVVAVVIEAVLRIGRRVLKNPAMVAVSAAAFTAIFVFKVDFPWIILTAALLGTIGGRVRPDLFAVSQQHKAKASLPPKDQFVINDAVVQAPHTRPSLPRAVLTALVWLAIWIAPVALLAWRYGPQSVFVQEGVFFSRAAVVTFGGAYAVLPYVQQQAVHHFGWVTEAEMMDGLGLAETTPGPLIMVVQFVGFLGAFHTSQQGPLDPYLAGVIGSIVTTWVTFAPCFLYIFVGAPYIERLRGISGLNAAPSTITAAVMGVVLNLAVWFAWHTIVPSASAAPPTFLRVAVSPTHTLDLAALALSVGAGIALIRFRANLLLTLAASCLLGLVVGWLRT